MGSFNADLPLSGASNQGNRELRCRLFKSMRKSSLRANVDMYRILTCKFYSKYIVSGFFQTKRHTLSKVLDL